MTVRKLLLLTMMAAPLAAYAADSTQSFRFTQDPSNMTACLKMAPQFEREHTLTVAGDSVKLTGPGGLNTQMKAVKPNVYETVLELSGERLDYVADLAAKMLTVKGNNLGCKWSAKLQ